MNGSDVSSHRRLPVQFAGPKFTPLHSPAVLVTNTEKVWSSCILELLKLFLINMIVIIFNNYGGSFIYYIFINQSFFSATYSSDKWPNLTWFKFMFEQSLSKDNHWDIMGY